LAESGDLDYYFSKPEYEAQDLVWKSTKSSEEGSDPLLTRTHLQEIGNLIFQIPTNSFTAPSVKKNIWQYAEEKGRGVVLWPMRYALSGKEKSPDPFTLAEVIGKKETLERLAEAINKLSTI